MKLVKSIWAVLLFGSFSAAVQAVPWEDYKICRTYFETVSYFQGNASCYATPTGGSNLPPGSGRFLSQNVGLTTNSSVYLSQPVSAYVDGEWVHGSVSCVASVPFSHSEEVEKESCYYDLGAVCRDYPRLPLCR
ncbi:hypothetical protein [Aliikangiella coralliicola]|uniref:Uncharacterized protein n=1 Tax=Aliikangiella coralliicola TaxID=2592383 RepID=A0A545UCW8_9GAMM|nr:hypothetical protein [Aliikangiella coralliicola]TQV87310.1 hypothetical protein FLL46_12740 [Aliikangiella coralliicola]